MATRAALIGVFGAAAVLGLLGLRGCGRRSDRLAHVAHVGMSAAMALMLWPGAIRVGQLAAWLALLAAVTVWLQSLAAPADLWQDLDHAGAPEGDRGASRPDAHPARGREGVLIRLYGVTTVAAMAWMTLAPAGAVTSPSPGGGSARAATAGSMMRMPGMSMTGMSMPGMSMGSPSGGSAAASWPWASSLAFAIFFVVAAAWFLATAVRPAGLPHRGLARSGRLAQALMAAGTGLVFLLMA